MEEGQSRAIQRSSLGSHALTGPGSSRLLFSEEGGIIDMTDPLNLVALLQMMVNLTNVPFKIQKKSHVLLWLDLSER